MQYLYTFPLLKIYLCSDSILISIHLDKYFRTSLLYFSPKDISYRSAKVILNNVLLMDELFFLYQMVKLKRMMFHL